MNDVNPVSTPMETCRVLGEVKLRDEYNNVPYWEAVGSLMYLSAATRSDTSYVVSYCFQSLAKPTLQHWQAMKIIFKYLRGTSKLGILFTSHGGLEAYCDASHTDTRKSVSGFVSLLSVGACRFCSNLVQPKVSLSTTEAECIAACEASKELVWLKRLLKEITTCNICPTLKSHSMSAVKLARYMKFHKWSKHIDVRYHFVREKLEGGVFKLICIVEENQVADVLTKPLPASRLKRIVSLRTG